MSNLTDAQLAVIMAAGRVLDDADVVWPEKLHPLDDLEQRDTYLDQAFLDGVVTLAAFLVQRSPEDTYSMTLKVRDC